MYKFLKFFKHPIPDTALVFILTSTITSIFLYQGELDQKEAIITLIISLITTINYYFLVYKSNP
jgi:hypothetical protein